MAKKNESGRATVAAAAAPPVRHRIEATTICFNEEAAPAGEYTVRVACTAQESLPFRRGGGQSPYVLEDDATKTFDLAEIRTAGACRLALRGMLEELPQLRLLHLAPDEWDAVVPEDVMPAIIRAACRGCEGGKGFTFCISMYVRRRVIQDERALLMACKEMPAAAAPDNCAICFDGLEGGEPAVELPVCAHAFHRRCISQWFVKATTCPMCQADVRLSALTDFLELCPSTGGEAAHGTKLVPGHD